MKPPSSRASEVLVCLPASHFPILVANKPQACFESKEKCAAALVGWFSWLEHRLIHKGCGFYPQSGHLQESTNECMNKCKTKLVSLSLCLSYAVFFLLYFLSLINQLKKKSTAKQPPKLPGEGLAFRLTMTWAKSSF